ncbi:hypothetical protein M0638_12585 [Roseomonas sp. NAR14]|uniref:Uncharacterized protein n=1 Tax=Roseomonas acroporae TaxID=2937791 RepID=A0A9X1YAN9_9PROT|nr:hypothetical protein [Roseomonas acroporae]MCK8785222.1 hypothetical protein [Roseomonas acroporae]
MDGEMAPPGEVVHLEPFVPQPGTWFVAFQPADTVWWHRLCRKGFAHCFAFAPRGNPDRAGEVHWVFFDPAFTCLDVRLIPFEAVVEAFAMNKVGALRILRIDRQGARLARPRWVVTCAGAIAALLGMRATPLTPWGLYRRMLAAGAEVVP